MSKFRVFEGGIEFFRCMKQLAKDVKDSSFPYHIFVLARRSDAMDVICFYRAEAQLRGLDPEQVMGFRDPVSKTWIVLAPRVMGDMFGIGWSDPS